VAVSRAAKSAAEIARRGYENAAMTDRKRDIVQYKLPYGEIAFRAATRTPPRPTAPVKPRP
jgi:hypothetical protein